MPIALLYERFCEGSACACACQLSAIRVIRVAVTVTVTVEANSWQLAAAILPCVSVGYQLAAGRFFFKV